MSMQTASVSSAAAVLQILSGYWSSRAVYAAAKLGIADLIQDGPKTAAELASRTETHPPSLYRLLRALASIGWLTEDEGRFGPTPLTPGIQSGVPGSLRNLAITELGQEHYPAWEDLLFSLRPGDIAFNQAMSEVTAVTEPAVLAAYEFSDFNKIVDVGGGRGTLIASILRACPKAR